MPEKMGPLPEFLSISLQIPFPADFVLKYSHSQRIVSIDPDTVLFVRCPGLDRLP